MTRLVPLITLMSVLLTACGGGVAAAKQAGGETAVGAQAPIQAPSTPASTAEAAAGSREEVVIQLGESSIDSSQTTFKAGVTYRFVITNYSSRPQEFNINEPVAIKGTYEGAISGALLRVPRIIPGGTETVEFTFPTNAPRKQWEFSSLIKNLYEDGMRWAIVVTA